MIYQINYHRVQHGDVMNGVDDLMQGKKADIVYSDPPWGQGNLTYWQTINKKMTGAQPKPMDYNAFINQIFSIAQQYTKQYFFIEYGQKWHSDIKLMGAKYGFQDLATIKLLYRSGSKLLPLDLHIFAKEKLDLPEGYIASITNSHGFETLKKVIIPIAKPGMIILDPCCGMGYTAQIAKDCGLTFYGNELNAKRLEKTRNRLA